MYSLEVKSDPPHTPTGPLFSGPFGWFFFGRTVTIFGSSMTPVALSLSVLKQTGSPVDLGIVLAANMIATLIFMLVGGTLADRLSRRTLLIASNVASALVLAGIATLLATGSYTLYWMTALSALQGAVAAFEGPAFRGIVPELAPANDLQRANAALSSTRSASRIIGPLVAGILVGAVGGAVALAVDAVANLVAGLFFMHLPPSGKVKAQQSITKDLVEGWRAFTSLRWVMIMSVSFAFINALNVGPWQVLGPLVVSEKDGPIGWGSVLSIRAIGLLLAGLVLMRLVLKKPLTTGRMVGTLGALPLLALGFTSNFWWISAAAFLGGIALTFGNVTYDSTLQSNVPLEVLSRVSAYDDLLAYVAIPLSQLAVGPAIQTFGAQKVAIFCGTGYAIASLAPLLTRSVRAVDNG